MTKIQGNFYRSTDPDAIRKLVDDQAETPILEGDVFSANSTSAQVKIRGSSKQKRVSILSGLEIAQGDHVIMLRSDLTQQPVIIGKYVPHTTTSTPTTLSAAPSSGEAPLVPSNLVINPAQGMLIASWQVGADAVGVFQVEVADNTFESGAIFAIVSGSTFPYATNAAKYFRVRAADTTWHFSNWTGWVASVAPLSPTGLIPIINGGTGQSNQTDAFDALNPTTAIGDLIGNDGTNAVAVPVDSDNLVLTADSTAAVGWKWKLLSLVNSVTGLLGIAHGGTGVDLSASGAAHDFLAQDASHVISARVIATADLPTLPATSVTPGTYTNTDLTVGADGRITAASDGTGGGTASPLTTAGDLYYYDTAEDRLPISTNHFVLQVDTSLTGKIKWALVSLVNSVTGLLGLTNGGTGADLSGTGGTGQYLRQSSVGAVITVGAIPAADYPTFVASGASHATGAVPDPGSSAGTTKFLREDATFAVPPGTGSGTVTSVAMTVPSDQSISGSPVTSSGTLAITDNTQSANMVKAGPVSGGVATPGYRALVAADIPSLPGSIIGSGTVAAARLDTFNNFPTVSIDSAADYILFYDTSGAVNAKILVANFLAAGQTRQMFFSMPGTLNTSTTHQRIYNVLGVTQTFVKVFISADTAPTGAAVIVDIFKNGVTIFTNSAHRPQIAAGANTGSTTTFDVGTWLDGDYLTFQVAQLGSTVAGANLTIQIEVTG